MGFTRRQKVELRSDYIDSMAELSTFLSGVAVGVAVGSLVIEPSTILSVVPVLVAMGSLLIELGTTLLEVPILVAVGSLLIYAWFVHRQTLVMQESQWIPEAIHYFGEKLIRFRGKRPWYPEFKVEVSGDSSGWIDQNIAPPEIKDDQTDVDTWVVDLPSNLWKDFLITLDEGRHSGKLFFKFESMTGEEYKYIYDITFEKRSDSYEINGAPSVERNLPWEKSIRKRISRRISRPQNLL